MNDILKKAYRNKRILTFFSTRDPNRKYHIAEKIIVKQTQRKVNKIKLKFIL